MGDWAGLVFGVLLVHIDFETGFVVDDFSCFVEAGGLVYAEYCCVPIWILRI